jgi:O-antigen/teichoic acid export membrane protein
MADLGSLLNLRPLLKSGAVLFVGMTVANVANYALNLIVGRLLGPVEFGAFVALVSFAALLSMPASALAMIAGKFSSAAVAAGRPDKLRGLFRLLTRVGWQLGGVLLVGLVVAAQPLASFLHLASSTPILVAAISFSLTFVLLVGRGLIQGLQRFPILSFNIALEPVVKIAATVGLISLGFGLNGALMSYAIAFAVCYLAIRWSLRGELIGPTTPVDRPALWRYSLPTVVALTALSFLTSIDVVLVKHYFNPADAGLFAGVATVGKIILYIAAPLVAVMFPLIVSKVSHGDRHFPLLAQTFVLVATLSVAVLALFSLFPAFTVRLLFGSQYVAAAPYLPGYSLVILLLSLATVFVHYFLSIGLTRVSLALVVALGLEVVAVSQFHDSIGQVITSLTLVFGVLFAGLSFGYLWLKRVQLTAVFRHTTLGSQTLP